MKSYVLFPVWALERSYFCCLSQTSGSLYGALIGSAVAFQIADWLGWFFYPTAIGVTFQLWLLWLKLLNLFIGRRRELIVSALFYFLGALVTAFAPVYVILVIGRLLYGVGIGLVRYCNVFNISFPFSLFYHGSFIFSCDLWWWVLRHTSPTTPSITSTCLYLH